MDIQVKNNETGDIITLSDQQFTFSTAIDGNLNLFSFSGSVKSKAKCNAVLLVIDYLKDYGKTTRKRLINRIKLLTENNLNDVITPMINCGLVVVVEPVGRNKRKVALNSEFSGEIPVIFISNIK